VRKLSQSTDSPAFFSNTSLPPILLYGLSRAAKSKMLASSFPFPPFLYSYFLLRVLSQIGFLFSPILPGLRNLKNPCETTSFPVVILFFSLFFFFFFFFFCVFFFFFCFFFFCLFFFFFFFFFFVFCGLCGGVFFFDLDYYLRIYAPPSSLSLFFFFSSIFTR